MSNAKGLQFWIGFARAGSPCHNKGLFNARGFIAVISALLLWQCPIRHAVAAEFTMKGSRPNVIIIMADDMGYSDIGAFGGEISTPNLDRLAAGGMRLRQFYNTGRCCPTRAALLTGLYSHQAGVGHMVENHGFPGYQGFLNDSCLTIAEMVHPSGYQTFMSGKWHVGERPGHWPADRGFDNSYSLVSGGSNYWKLDKGRIFAIDHTASDPTTEPNFHFTDGFTDAASRYVSAAAPKAKSGSPFFLYLAYTAPHWPLHARPEDIAKYKGKYMKGWDVLREERRKRQIELGVIDASVPLTPRNARSPAWDSVSPGDQEAFDLKMAVFAAQVEQLDRGVGKVLKTLSDSGLTENTMVLFLADNGGCAEEINRSEVPGTPPGPKESFLSYGLPWANASNTPFRLFKHWVHEGGISSPFIAYWPGHIRANIWSNEPSHLIDLAPTVLELAGAEYPAEKAGKKLIPLEGRSLLSTFARAAQPERPIFWEHEGNRAVRLGKWKLVAQFKQPWELFDMEADRVEMHDLSASQPDKVKELTALYEKWTERAGVLPFGQVTKGPAKKGAAKSE